MTKSKVKIVFLGGGAHTIPSYRALLEKFADNYDLTVYSEFFIPSQGRNYTIKSVPLFKTHRRIRELIFGLLVLKDCFIQRVDIIHCHSTFPSGLTGAIIKVLLRIPLLVSLDAAEGVGLPAIRFGDMLHRKRTSVNRFVLNCATTITTLTHFQQNLVLQNLKPKREIKVIPRGINVSRFSFQENNIQSPVRFIHVAYRHPVKDQNTLLLAFALISSKIDCTLTIIGEDYMNGAIESLITTLGINDRVHVAGFIPHENIDEWYRRADVLLHTSAYESQAVAVVEAFASGVLVCGTHVGLMADLSGTHCLTVPVGEFENLAKTVLELLADPLRINQIRSAARKWSEEKDLDWTADEYRKLYVDLLSQSNPGKR